MKRKKIVLIGDIISSKEIKNRADIQSNLDKIFKKINSSDKNLSSPLTITLGDEFQGVFDKAESIFKNIWLISLSVYPVKIRFAIGIGEITTRLNKKQAIGMDGPAFYNARNGLNELKKTNYMLSISSEGVNNEGIFNEILYLISHLSNNWKKSRIEILTLLYDNYSVIEIAKKLGITDKAVYKNIHAGALVLVKDITNKISKKLDESLRK